MKRRSLREAIQPVLSPASPDEPASFRAFRKFADKLGAWAEPCRVVREIDHRHLWCEGILPHREMEECFDNCREGATARDAAIPFMGTEAQLTKQGVTHLLVRDRVALCLAFPYAAVYRCCFIPSLARYVGPDCLSCLVHGECSGLYYQVLTDFSHAQSTELNDSPAP